jgi:hypothetical protein
MCSESATEGSASQQQSLTRIEKCEKSVSHSFETNAKHLEPQIYLYIFKFQTENIYLPTKYTTRVCETWGVAGAPVDTYSGVAGLNRRYNYGPTWTQ